MSNEIQNATARLLTKAEQAKADLKKLTDLEKAYPIATDSADPFVQAVNKAETAELDMERSELAQQISEKMTSRSYKSEFISEYVKETGADKRDVVELIQSRILSPDQLTDKKELTIEVQKIAQDDQAELSRSQRRLVSLNESINRQDYPTSRGKTTAEIQILELQLANHELAEKMQSRSATSQVFAQLIDQNQLKSHLLSSDELLDKREQLSRKLTDFSTPQVSDSIKGEKELSDETVNTEKIEPKAEPASNSKASEKQATPNLDDYVPHNVRERYVRVDSTFYEKSRERKPAFIDEGAKLRTPSRDTPEHHVRSMVDIAEARQWKTLKVSGTNEFKSQVWFEAGLRGIEVIGYMPTDVERAMLADRLKKKHGNEIATNSIQRVDSQVATESTNSSQPIEQIKDANQNKAASRGRVYTGVLIAHGAANYQFNPKEPQNYYAELNVDGKNQQIWGVDIERAIKHADVKPGEQVTLEYKGYMPVEVNKPNYDKEGKLIGHTTEIVNRNAWAIHKSAQLAQPGVNAKAFEGTDALKQAAVSDPGLQISTNRAEIAERILDDLKLKPEDKSALMGAFLKVLHDDYRHGINQSPLVQQQASQKQSAEVPQQQIKKRKVATR